ncbi:Putative helicase mov-10-B.1 [Melipona quadrifasciata]|uniref:Putative helicase mov-10-B.1 n=1 Tax=Melipona quadrifasciata TaxID=166423 RepID=A0A0N0BG98_9HYME|nr:Putative helicase mov-10-B.1 [Melipona quadrifasciata]
MSSDESAQTLSLKEDRNAGKTNLIGYFGWIRHCTSFKVCKLMKLPRVSPPADLYAALNNTSPKNNKLYNGYVNFIDYLLRMKKIDTKFYLILFRMLLYLEEHELQSRYNLKNQKLRRVFNKFEIIVPTLDKYNPFITIGDEVTIQSKDLQHSYNFKIINITWKKVYVAISNEFPISQLLENEVDISFHSINWPLRCYHYVLDNMCHYNLENLINPKINTHHYILSKVDFDWVHKSVANNEEQKTAVKNILNNSSYPVPYIIFGPPGTGKTTTVVEAICQIRKEYTSKNILVCTSSNAAADEIAKRLLHLLPHKDIFRMYSASKLSSDIDKQIYPRSNFINDMILYLPKEIFIWKKIVISTFVTCMRLVNLKLQSDHFSYIFIDEASQNIELESLIPFIITNNKTEATSHAQVIIAGDPYQLGPMITCKKIEHLLGKSLLERLMECEPYQKVNNKYNSRYITKLIHNYRSKEAIIYTSNKEFYEIEGEETRTPCASVYNEREINVVRAVVKELMLSKIGNRKIKGEDIGILTPFKQQKIMIEKYVESNNITVGTIETFQGQEREIIILSTVRSKIFVHNNKRHIGFLSNPKRCNVAVTRAKDFLIVIGNPLILREEKYWYTLWQYCKENNATIFVKNIEVFNI